MVERFHRTMKSTIKCHDESWSDALPIVLMGLRATYKEDLDATPAEMVFGTTIRLPGEFLAKNEKSCLISEFANELRRVMDQLRPVPASKHCQEKFFVQKDLSTCTHVFVRDDKVRPALKQPYDGPFKVIRRDSKGFDVDIQGKVVKVSVNRIKAAFTPIEEFDQVKLKMNLKETPTKLDSNQLYKTRSGRKVRFRMPQGK